MVKSKRTVNYEKAWYALAAARILLGFYFFWAFLDKTMGLGFATPAEKAWVLGGSPTTGFLSGVNGPFANFFADMAGNPFVDWLFMLGLLGIGLSLILGIGLRVGGAARHGCVVARRGVDRAQAAGPAGRAGEDRSQVDRRRPVPA